MRARAPPASSRQEELALCRHRRRSQAKWNAVFVSLIASCELHKLEPWAYLRDLLCLLPSWPNSRILELAPKHRRETLQKTDAQQRLAAYKLRDVSLSAEPSNHDDEATRAAG